MARQVMLAAAALLFLAPAGPSAQSVDEVIEKAVAALGGRAAHAQITSRHTVGTITFSTPAGEISGPVEMQIAAPNKARTLIRADLTKLGAGPLVVDQRFDGVSGYVMDSLQGNRELTGNQLANMRHNAFPHLLLKLKDLGTTATLPGRERVGTRDAYVLVLQPASGPAVRQYIDAETFLPVRLILKVQAPQTGAEVDQVTDLLDYRVVDDIKVPFRLTSTSPGQSLTIVISSVRHNVAFDDALFRKPAP